MSSSVSRSWLLALIVLIVILVGSWLYANVAQAPSQSNTEMNNWTTYTNDEYNFSVQYSGRFTLTPGDSQEYPVGSALVTKEEQQGSAPTIVTLTLNEEPYPTSNLAGAWVSISVAEMSGEESCAMMLNGTEKMALKKVEEHLGLTWYQNEDGWLGEGAAGTTFQSYISHTWKNNTCYEVNLNLATTNIGNYDPGTVTAVDEGALRAELMGIGATFQFTE